MQPKANPARLLRTSLPLLGSLLPGNRGKAAAFRLYGGARSRARFGNDCDALSIWRADVNLLRQRGLYVLEHGVEIVTID